MQGIDQAASGAGDAARVQKAHPLTLVRVAYGLERKVT
jgi:hypothetical protein